MNNFVNFSIISCRYQCIPLYKVKYNKSGQPHSNGHGGHKFDSDEYVEARKDLPEICWKKSDRYEHPMPSIRRLQNIWPFSSNKIFGKMGVDD